MKFLLGVKASEGMRKIVTKYLILWHEVVRVWYRKRHKPRIIQCGVVSRGLREEFNLRDRGDGRGPSG